MRLGFFHESFLTTNGGASLFLKRLCETLAERGHDITIFASEPQDENYANRLSRGKLNTLHANRWKTNLIQRLSNLQQVRGGYRLFHTLDQGGKLQLQSRGAVTSALADKTLYADFDAVILNESSSSAWLPDVATHWKGLRAFAIPLLHVHEPSAKFPVQGPFHEVFEGILTLTQFEADHLRKEGWNQAIIEPIGAGSDPFPEPIDPKAFRDRYAIPADVPLVLFLGRKILNKGVSHVVEAMDQVWDRHPDARLALLGFSKNPPEWLEGYIKKSRHDAAAKTVNLYDCERKEVEEALAACTLLAAPSISDSFGMVYLDAWRHKKPVIACSDTCCESIIDEGRNGNLVPFGDVDAIATRIAWHLDHPADSATMGEAGFETWKSRFQWEQVADAFEFRL